MRDTSPVRTDSHLAHVVVEPLDKLVEDDYPEADSRPHDEQDK